MGGACPLQTGIISDGLLPLMEFHEQVNGLDYRKVVFVLVSSVGGREVNDVAIENAAVPRHELHIRDFEKQVRPPGRESLKLPFTGHKCRL